MTTKWVDASYVNDKGRRILWIVPEGGKKSEGITAKDAMRVLDSDTVSLRTVAMALLAESAPATVNAGPFWIAVAADDGTFSVLNNKQYNAAEIRNLMAGGTIVQLYVNSVWVKPESVGIVVMPAVAPPPPAPLVKNGPPPGPAEVVPTATLTSITPNLGYHPPVGPNGSAAQSTPPASPAGASLKDRVMAAQKG